MRVSPPRHLAKFSRLIGSATVALGLLLLIAGDELNRPAYLLGIAIGMGIYYLGEANRET